MEGDWPKGKSPRSGKVFFSSHKKQEIQQLTQEKARQHHALSYCLISHLEDCLEWHEN